MSDITNLSDSPDFISTNFNCRFDGAWLLNVSDSHFKDWYSSSSYSIAIMLDGEAEIKLKTPDKDEEIYLWEKTAVLCLNPFVQRQLRITSQGNIKYLAIKLTCQISGNINILSLYDIPVILPHNQTKPIAIILKNFMTLKNCRDLIAKTIQANNLCTQLLLQLTENLPQKKLADKQISCYQRVYPAIEFFNKNYNQPVDIETAAKLCCLSKSRFHNVFKNSTGLSPNLYVKKIRLTASAKLLLASDKSIETIGREAGWNDQFHFSRTFKKYFGCSPLNYRNHAKLV